MYDLRDFGISIDTLLSGSGDSEKMMIGIDGGGTQTEFVLFSESGRVLNRIVLGGSKSKYGWNGECNQHLTAWH